MKTMQNKQIIGFISIFLFTFMCVADIYGQSYKRSQLTEKEWVLRIPGKTYYATYFFTDREHVSKSFINDGVKTDLNTKYLYYLSDEIEKTFQLDSVGKSKKGKYIVSLSNPDIEKANVEHHEILELTKTTLKTRHVRSGTILEYKVE